MAIGRHPTQSRGYEGGLFRRPTGDKGILSWLTTVDHKRLGLLYIFTTLFFFSVASIEAFMIRLQIAVPGQNIISPDTYNAFFTMHGVTMIFFAIMPLGTGLANYFVPLMIGARDLAFPRLNAFGYWIFLAGGLVFYSSIFLGQMPDVGWFAYAPMTMPQFRPGSGVDFYMVGLGLSGIGTLVTAMNIIVTIINMRAPGMTMMRVPLFVWMMLITAFLVIFAFPPFTVAVVMVIMDRTFGTLFFNPVGGGLPILWQHLFWILGHPEVYIVILPAFGVIHEVIPTFSRKPLFGYPVVVLAGIFIGFMGFAVWTHHMFTTGIGPVAAAAFAITSFIIGVPTGVKVFNWIATMWGGQVRFTTSMLFAIGFLFTFVIGGITGIMLAVPPFDAQAHDGYFVVAHFHYVMAGGALMAFLSAAYYWFPKISGRMLNETVGKVVFWLVTIGFHTIFFPQHFLGLNGMPRRIHSYGADLGWNTLNMLSTAGVFVMGAGLLLFAFSFFRDMFAGKPAGNDPWDARTLEWTTTSPPPHYNFAQLPEVLDRDPLWIQKHPELIEHRDPLSEMSDEGPKYIDMSKEDGIHLPGQSWYPFLMTLALTAGGYGIIYHNALLGILAVVATTICTFAWAFEGVGGHHIHLEEHA